MTADDQLASTLAGIRVRNNKASYTDPISLAITADDVPVLLAAIDAVLKLADDWEADAAAIARRVEGHAARGDGHAAAFARGSAEALDDCVRTLREAISRELSGTRQTQPGEDGES